MDSNQIVSKMNSYTFISAEILEKWLGKVLPQVSENWWDKCVMENLTNNQRETVINRGITNLSQLDLAALLNVAEGSSSSLRSIYYLSESEKNCLKKMKDVRNDWAHVSVELPNKDKILADLTTLRTFFRLFDSGNKNLHREIDSIIEVLNNPSAAAKAPVKTVNKPHAENKAKASRTVKFESFEKYISEKTESRFTLTFGEIEAIMDNKLCDSAYTYVEYWSPSGHSFPRMVQSYGYRMKPDLKNQKVLFYREEL